MSLVAFAMRISAVRAIRAVVWPEFVIVDSPQKPLALLEQGKPLIAIYTGHDTDRMEGRELYAGDTRATLTIQIFLPAEFTITVGTETLTLDTREEGAETVLDVVARRVMSAFLDAGAEPNSWSELWQHLVQSTTRSQNISYLVETAEVRTSARELTLECSVLNEPIPGAAPAGVWADLIKLMRADTGASSVAPLADWISAEIAGPAMLPQQERDRIDLGLSRYLARDISILPIVPNTETVPIAEIDIDHNGLAVVIGGLPPSAGGPSSNAPSGA